MTIPQIDVHEHCPHPTGSGTTHGWGGGDEVVCCHCGLTGVQRWEIVRLPITGHGPHATVPTKRTLTTMWRDGR